MRNKTPLIPSLKLHKATGQGYVLLDGVRHYLGRFDEPTTRSKADVLVAEYLANGRRLRVEPSDLMISELCNAFRKHCDAYYVGRDGKPSQEAKHFHTVIKAMRELYGASLVCEFGPLRFKAVRERLMTENRSRTYINKLTTKLRAIFKWGVAEEMVPAAVYQALQAVPGLKRGRTMAKETEPVKPVPIEHVDAIRPYVSKQVWSIIRLQLLTAARQGELVIMRPIDIDTTSDVWVYEPKEHKNAYRDQQRKIYLGPKAQEVIRTYLRRPVESYVFSAREAEAERRMERTKARKTPLSCGNCVGSNCKAVPKRVPGDRYTSGSYRRAIADACKQAGTPSWHPHALRHNAATELRKQFGLDIAAIMLGHAHCDVTQVYAERNHEAAKHIAAQVG